MDGLDINILLVIVVAAAVLKIIDGYRKGMVKEIISLISMIVLCVVAALIGYGVNNYHDGKIFNVIVSVILLCLLATVHHFLGVLFFSAKLVTKLPVVHFLDKLLGIVFGILEVVLLLWTIYAFAMMMNLGVIGQMILSYTEKSPILSWIYRHNYLAHWIERFLDEFRFVPLVGELIP